MVEKRNRKHIVIASKSFVSRLGIRTILSSIGLDAEITEVSELESVEGVDFDHLIINSDVLPLTKKNVAQQINDTYKQKSVMVIDNQVSELYPDFFQVSSLGDRKSILDQFQSFIFGHDLVETIEESVLTEREIEVLRKVAQGNANKEIADKLFISINTVITHRKNITEKLGVKTIAGLTVYAIMNSIINPEEVTF